MLTDCQYRALFLQPLFFHYLRQEIQGMNQFRRIYRILLTTSFLLIIISFSQNSFAADGEALFKANCASCHKPDAAYVGPALAGARERQPSEGWVYKWIANATSMGNTDPYAMKLKEQFGGLPMTAFPGLAKEEVDAILDYADSYTPPAADSGPGGAAPTASADTTIWYGLLTLILAIIGLTLVQVNSNLKKLTDEREGKRAPPPVPFYRNKAYLLMLVIVLFLVGGYFIVEGAMGLGRHEGYQPLQPIYYSHKVHAGANQISCLYCHSGAQESKHANIPSVNVCMNCHMAIKEYAGEPLRNEDGKAINGNAEIQKLYQYAGWNPDTKKYDKPGAPIEWVRIHNLPDLVYFNHAQHVTVGRVQCQTCHGEIQKMDEVKQFADLSMGWCVNCHRTSKVQFNDGQGNGNKFYSIYEKFHQDIKNNKYDSVTVEQIGGTECQKCHY